MLHHERMWMRITILLVIISNHLRIQCFKLDPFTKCYGKYGCYSLKYPWYSSHRVVNLFPKSATDIEVNFFLYTRQNRRKRQELFEDDVSSIKKSNFDAKK